MIINSRKFLLFPLLWDGWPTEVFFSIGTSEETYKIFWKLTSDRLEGVILLMKTIRHGKWRYATFKICCFTSAASGSWSVETMVKYSILVINIKHFPNISKGETFFLVVPGKNPSIFHFEDAITIMAVTTSRLMWKIIQLSDFWV